MQLWKALKYGYMPMSRWTHTPANIMFLMLCCMVFSSLSRHRTNCASEDTGTLFNGCNRWRWCTCLSGRHVCMTCLWCGIFWDVCIHLCNALVANHLIFWEELRCCRKKYFVSENAWKKYYASYWWASKKFTLLQVIFQKIIFMPIVFIKKIFSRHAKSEPPTPRISNGPHFHNNFGSVIDLNRFCNFCKHTDWFSFCLDQLYFLVFL